MVRKTRSTTIKTVEKIRKESPRRTRRRRSTSKSGDSDEEVQSKKEHCSNRSEKGSSGNESDTDSKKPLKKRNISIAVGSVKNINSDSKSSNKDDQQDEGEEVKASKGKSKSISMSNNDGCKPEIEQVTEESPNDENAGNVASDELSKNGTETSEIDVNISQSLVAEMTCDNQSSEIAIVPEQTNIEAIPKEVEPKTKEVPSSRTRPSRFSDGPTEEVATANKSTSSESSKKIKLNRLPRDNNIAASDDKEAKKKLITLKRPEIKQSSLDDPNKQEETQESLPPAVDEWGSTYELSSEEKDEKASRRKITLKRLTAEEKSDKKDVARSVSLQETSATPADNIVINEKRRHSTGVEKSLSESDEKPLKPNKPTKVVKLIRTLPGESLEPPPPGEELVKKHKWSNIEVARPPIEPLNLETLQELCPNAEFLNEADVDLDLDAKEKKSPEKVKEKTFLELEEEEMENIEAELNAEPEKVDTKENIIAMNRKISIVEDTASKLKPPPSPAKNPVSDVLFITNLVRPFTVKQLKELLERTGKIQEEGFWTDKIKSKCYVQYETIEQAESTRNALHGVHWPIGNGKKLIIDYATVQDVENAKNPPIIVPKKEKSEKENKRPTEVPDEKVERREVGATKREWDVGKESDRRHRRSRSKSGERRERKHSRRSHTPVDNHNKKRKHEEPPPQKAMDDLFLKTKATPSIYWQPLSPEEIARKQQQRQARLEENKRRLEEIRSSARSGPRDRSGRDRNFRRR